MTETTTPQNGHADNEKAAPVRPEIPGQTIVQLEEADAKMAREAAASVMIVNAALGEERAAYLAREKELLAQLQERQQDYASTVRTMTKKYIRTKGQFNFSPELGAFVGFEHPEKQEE